VLGQYRFENAEEDGLHFLVTLLKRRYPEAFFLQTAGEGYVTLVTNVTFTDEELGYLRAILDVANSVYGEDADGGLGLCISVSALEKVMP